MIIFFSRDPIQPPSAMNDGIHPTGSSFLPVVNEPPPQAFHFNPTAMHQPTSSMYPPTTASMTSDFVHHPPSHEPSARAAPTPPPAPVVKGPLPSEHQIIQDTFDLLANRCQQATQQLPLKRKLDEVKKKLDVLYDKLRENRVTNEQINVAVV